MDQSLGWTSQSLLDFLVGRFVVYFPSHHHAYYAHEGRSFGSLGDVGAASSSSIPSQSPILRSRIHLIPRDARGVQADGLAL